MKKIYSFLTISFFSFQLLAVETTSDIRGKVLNSSGSAASNASVVVTYEPTNSTFKTSTNESGAFIVSNLKIGGPYKISVSLGSQTIKRKGIYLSLGKSYNLPLSLTKSEID